MVDIAPPRDRFKLVLFDLDNTLINTDESSRIALGMAYRELGFEEKFGPFDSFWSVYHSWNLHIWGLYNVKKLTREQLNDVRFSEPLKRLGCGSACVASQELTKRFYEHFYSVSVDVPGNREILRLLKPHFHLALITNGSLVSQTQKVAQYCLDGLVEHMFLGDDYEFPKPHPAIFLDAARHFGCTAGECVVVGDDYSTDILGAHAAGMTSVWFNPQSVAPPSGTAAVHSFQIRELMQLRQLLLG